MVVVAGGTGTKPRMEIEQFGILVQLSCQEYLPAWNSCQRKRVFYGLSLWLPVWKKSERRVFEKHIEI